MMCQVSKQRPSASIRGQADLTETRTKCVPPGIRGAAALLVWSALAPIRRRGPTKWLARIAHYQFWTLPEPLKSPWQREPRVSVFDHRVHHALVEHQAARAGERHRASALQLRHRAGHRLQRQPEIIGDI